MLRIDHSHVNENARLKPGVYIRFKRYWYTAQVKIVYPDEDNEVVFCIKQ